MLDPAEATVIPNIDLLLCCSRRLSPAAQSIADEFFDSRGKFVGVMTDRDRVSSCSGRVICFEENTEDLTTWTAELVDCKEALSCATSVPMDTVLLGNVKFVNLTPRDEVLNWNLDLTGADFAMLVARYVSILMVLDISIDAWLTDAVFLRTGEWEIAWVCGLESFVAKYPFTILPSTAEVCADKCSDKLAVSDTVERVDRRTVLWEKAAFWKDAVFGRPGEAVKVSVDFSFE